MAENRTGDASRTCANPACDQTIAGRPNKLTCDLRCRKAFQRHRDRLLYEAQTVLETLGETGARKLLVEDEDFAASLTDAAEAGLRRRVAYESLSLRNIDPRVRRVSTRKTPSLPPRV